MSPIQQISVHSDFCTERYRQLQVESIHSTILNWHVTQVRSFQEYLSLRPSTKQMSISLLAVWWRVRLSVAHYSSYPLRWSRWLTLIQPTISTNWIVLHSISALSALLHASGLSCCLAYRKDLNASRIALHAAWFYRNWWDVSALYYGQRWEVSQVNGSMILNDWLLMWPISVILRMANVSPIHVVYYRKL